MTSEKALRIIVSGKVQGIGFRYFVQDTGRMLGINGWVRNRTDGSVEMEVFGNEDTLQRFMEAVRTNHPYAQVEEMQVEPIAATAGDYSGFKILL